SRASWGRVQLLLQALDGPPPELAGRLRRPVQVPADLLKRQKLLVTTRDDLAVLVRQACQGLLQGLGLLAGHGLTAGRGCVGGQRPAALTRGVARFQRHFSPDAALPRAAIA